MNRTQGALYVGALGFTCYIVAILLGLLLGNGHSISTSGWRTGFYMMAIVVWAIWLITSIFKDLRTNE